MSQPLICATPILSMTPEDETATLPARRGTEYRLPPEKFAILEDEIITAGLYRRTYRAHLLHFLSTLAGLGIVLYLLLYTDTWWVQVLNAIMAGFFTVQLGLLGHDLSHQGVFKSHRRNKLCAVLVWGLGCGLSEGRWYHKHNAHHQSPNHIGHDPDVEIPFIFDHTQTNLRSPFAKRWLFPYQHILFWVGLWFVYPYNILNSLRFIFRDFSWRDAIELLFMAIHFALVFTLTFTALPFATALMFNLLVLLTTGVYMGLIFAPNHKGEDMLAPEETFNWVHQITLTRNLNPSALTSYLCGGLNYQIEHHLFPTVSRFQYPHLSRIVQQFCATQGIPYQSVSWTESLAEIHQALKAESAAWH